VEAGVGVGGQGLVIEPEGKSIGDKPVEEFWCGYILQGVSAEGKAVDDGFTHGWCFFSEDVT
jgi:hypothetical protein